MKMTIWVMKKDNMIEQKDDMFSINSIAWYSR